jgi:hypothetical protein
LAELQNLSSSLTVLNGYIPVLKTWSESACIVLFFPGPASTRVDVSPMVKHLWTGRVVEKLSVCFESADRFLLNVVEKIHDVGLLNTTF